MYLSNTAISRPVFATMVILALVVLGIATIILINVDLFPDIDFPYVVVTTVYPGGMKTNFYRTIKWVVYNSPKM